MVFFCFWYFQVLVFSGSAIINTPDYPLKSEINNPNRQTTQRSIRTTSIKEWKDSAGSKLAEESFTIDTARLWNHAPLAIKNAKTIQAAKTHIEKHCQDMAF